MRQTAGALLSNEDDISHDSVFVWMDV